MAQRSRQHRDPERQAAQRGRRRSSYDEAASARERRHRAISGAGPSSRWPLPGLLMLAFAVVVLRLVWLQVVTAGDLSAKAEAVYGSSVTVSAKRGTIYDRNGNVLAASVECRTLYCNPSAMASEKKAAASEVLAEVLGGDAADYLSTLSQDTTFAYIQKQVDTDAATQVTTELANRNIDGVYSMADVKRVYPYGSAAGQVLGFIGTDGHGLSGLELYYDDLLSGEDGEMVMEQGLDGTPIAGGVSEIHEATDGTDIIISLDVNIQMKAEEQLTQTVSESEAGSGNVVVTDPTTGEILAAASTPLYNPDDSSTLTNEALKLSCVSDSYEPGSTFKTLTMAIGYDTGTITQNSTFSVPAEVKVGDDIVSDDDGRDYTMDMTPYEIMRRSSNTGAALVGYAIGAEKFSAGIAAFGIGQLTGVDFPGEVSGLVTSGDQYTTATLGSMSFGQALAVPSLQVVRAVGAIANKGVLTTPHFLVQKGSEKVDWGEGTRAVSEEAASLTIEDMVGVVEEGTGTSAQVEGYTVAGKTGTGEQASSEGGYEGGTLMSSFVGFANADDAKVLVYVGVYDTSYHGGTIAAPAFSAIMSEALSDLGVRAE